MFRFRRSSLPWEYNINTNLSYLVIHVSQESRIHDTAKVQALKFINLKNHFRMFQPKTLSMLHTNVNALFKDVKLLLS